MVEGAALEMLCGEIHLGFESLTLRQLGGVAQLGERTVRIRKVESSILFVSTIKKSEPAGFGFFLLGCAAVCRTIPWLSWPAGIRLVLMEI